MLRKFLLPALAIATLAGCATDYAYRDGNGGDYYYGRPRVDYRYSDPYGYYGEYAPRYYYDRYGRLVYGDPYAAYGYPYGYGSSGWYRPRPHRDHDHDGERNDRKPPWRNIGGLLPPAAGTTDEDGEDARPRRRATPFMMPTPPRAIAPVDVPRMRSDGEGGSRMGRMIRNAKAADSVSGE